MTRHRLDDNVCAQSEGLARFDDVLDLLRTQIETVATIEERPLTDARGAVLGQDLTAPRPVPAFNNAAVDGYAFRHGDLEANDYRLTLDGEVFAGKGKAQPLKPGTAKRIFTGAIMPTGADTCLMQENARIDGDKLVVPDNIKPGANWRKAGEDHGQGDTILTKGTRLRANELGAIASLGLASVPVRAKLKVALVSTGDEIIRPGTPIAPGEIYDSNFHLLTGLAGKSDIIVDDIGIVADDRASVEARIVDIADKYDLILSTGGASVGDKDFIIDAIDKLGTLHSWKIAIKPGRPLAVGQVGGAVYMGLPGNPVAAFVTWLLFVLPVIDRLQGANFHVPVRLPLPAAFSMPRRKTGRREFLRGWLETVDGTLSVLKFGRDGSGLISGLTRSTGLIEIAEDVKAVEVGDPVSFIPFSGFFDMS